MTKCHRYEEVLKLGHVNPKTEKTL